MEDLGEVCIVTTVLCVLLLRETGFVNGTDSCVKTGPCSCKSSQGTIDLSPLASEGSARFSDISELGAQWRFSWNPCKSFTEGTCDNVAACQSSTSGLYYNIGTQDSAKFGVDSTTGHVTLSYSAQQTIPMRTSTIDLTCDENEEGTFTYNKEDPPASGNFFFTLTSKYACPRAVETKSSSISVGSILCIVLFSVIFVYVISGISYLTFVRKASGKEKIPNYSLWSSVPGLIRDGVLFTVKCGKSSTYDKI